MSYTYEVNSNTGYATGGSYKAFEWTTEPPKVSGIYFAKEKGTSYIRCVELDKSDDTVFLHGYDQSYRAEDFTHWLGPISIPEKPE